MWDNHGNVSDWSKTNYFEVGILDNSKWIADWISTYDDDNCERSPYFRYRFEVRKPLKRAILYATALGLYEAWLNNKRVSDYYFTPGWTSYHKRIQYQAYDVTQDIKIGQNVIGAILGAGWYKGTLGWEGKKNIYGDRLAFLAQLHLYYADGTEEIISTDEKWEYKLGPILFSEFYDGEIYDARLELQEWMNPALYDKDWKKAKVIEYRKDILVAQENIPARKMEVIKPVAIITTPKRETVIDFGQNMVGFVRFKVKGNAGDRVVLKHAEVLDKEGNFYTDNLRKAKQTIEYILKGDYEEIFEPHFTYQGFRYVKVEEYPGKVDINNFEGIVIYSGMETTGEFECSDDLVNRLQKNIVWSQKGNFVDVPTDCPQRDERLGWTGDAQVFIKTACFNMDVALFFTKWLHDLAADQFENGGVPFVIPNIFFSKTQSFGDEHSSSAWGDAATICPWTIYQYYADKRLLEQQYQSMKKWVEYIRKQGDNEYLWNTGFHFGDWVALDTIEGSYIGATPKDLIATAFYAYSTWILSQTAKVLGYVEDVEEYTKLYHNIVTEFRKEFVTPNGRLAAHTQTAHVLALMFDLLEKKDVEKNVEMLIELLKEIDITDASKVDYALTTGFVGTPYLCHVLTKYGRSDIALKLLLRKKYPSWLYQVLKGATTIWEHWDGIKEDGTFWDANMNSFNHYAYGSIGDWMYSVLGGLNILEPGFKKFLIKPYFEYFNYVKLKYKSMYGDIFVRWEKQVNSIKLELIVPANTEAIVELEKIDTDTFKILSQENSGSETGIKDITINENIIKISIGSGNYKFEFKKI
ncbi:alpha-L-rhamnosidase [Caldicellulosiruptor sp. F32]|uniref:alpha-L-rhamnosidase n=1 Tax=Caldicellulosiruptor sp. F32 TaxID=1214564 RepID=UPI0027D7E1EA|nr:alpha-L-rhamnosidase [Caldicellulosiruptor sp. F32]